MTPASRSELAKTFYGEGVELGVAAGAFSEIILKQGRIRQLWSIDRWSDHHGISEYFEASKRLSRAGQGRVLTLRSTFSEALPLFNDESLDFVYIDGYAHTGQEGGATLRDWWAKLKPGGIFSGHDYHPRWAATVKEVDRFAEAHSLQVSTTAASGDEFPSWFLIKPKAVDAISVTEHRTTPPVEAGQTIILVGNGPSVLLRGDRGAEIDAFDHVIRFNTYALKGFKAQVGSKTTLWSTFGRGSRPRDEGEIPSAAIYIHGATPKIFDIAVPAAYGVPRAFFDDVRSRLMSRSQVAADARKKALLPSSGLVIALWLIEVYGVKQITLTGFDHFQKEESSGHHYWIPSAFSRPPEHDGDAEAEWFAELEAAGLISYLGKDS
jgi:hypothetical protein